MRPYRLHPAVRDELRDAAHWYQERAPGLGRKFLRQVRRRLDAIRGTPSSGPLWRGVGPERYVRVKPFAYYIVYLEEEQGLLIKAVVHAKRRPRRSWRKRK